MTLICCPALLSMQQQPATMVQAWCEARQRWHTAGVAPPPRRQEAAWRDELPQTGRLLI